MISTTLSILTCFELNNDPKNFNITDDSPFGAEGISLADVVGILRITGPNGAVVYENAGFATDDFSSPDIDHDVQLYNDLISLPLDVDGNVLVGSYTIEYKIEVIGATQPGIYSLVKNYEYCYEAPDVVISAKTDCFSSVLTGEDDTAYDIEGATTTSLLRTFTAYAPPTSGLPDSSTSNKVITVNPIATKTWTLEVSSDVQYDFTDGLCVIDTLTESIEHEVICDINLCDIYCCIDKLYQRYARELCVNMNEAERIKYTQLEPVIMRSVLFRMAIECGQNDKATTYYNEILSIAECEPGCSCADETPTQVVPVCPPSSSSDVVVAVGGNGAITLAVNIVGSTTTYTVELRQDLKDKLDALFNTTLTAGANITITPTIAPNGDIDYLIDANAAASLVSGKVVATDIELLDGTYSFSVAGPLLANLAPGTYMIQVDGYIDEPIGVQWNIKAQIFNNGVAEADSYREVGPESITGIPAKRQFTLHERVVVAGNDDVELRTEAILNSGAGIAVLKKAVMTWVKVA
jgi:hypothetical protein